MMFIPALKHLICLRNTGMLVLVPLTVDRFVAVVMPLRHRYLITKSSSRKMSAVVWTPIFVTLIIDIVAYNVTKDLKVSGSSDTMTNSNAHVS